VVNLYRHQEQATLTMSAHVQLIHFFVQLTMLVYDVLNLEIPQPLLMLYLIIVTFGMVVPIMFLMVVAFGEIVIVTLTQVYGSKLVRVL